MCFNFENKTIIGTQTALSKWETRYTKTHWNRSGRSIEQQVVILGFVSLLLERGD